MIINKFIYENAFDEFGFWDDKIKEQYEGVISAISLEVNGVIEDYNVQNLQVAKHRWAQNLSQIIEKNGLRLFLILYVPYSNPVSRLQEYKKLWGSFNDLNNFIAGEQICLKCVNGVLYCGAINFEANKVEEAINFSSEIPFLRTIVATKHNLLEKEPMQQLFTQVMHKNMQSKLDVKAYHLDFSELCNVVCRQGGVVFRIADIGEEEMITIFFDNNKFIGFNGLLTCST